MKIRGVLQCRMMLFSSRIVYIFFFLLCYQGIFHSIIADRQHFFPMEFVHCFLTLPWGKVFVYGFVPMNKGPKLCP